MWICLFGLVPGFCDSVLFVGVLDVLDGVGQMIVNSVVIFVIWSFEECG